MSKNQFTNLKFLF